MLHDAAFRGAKTTPSPRNDPSHFSFPFVPLPFPFSRRFLQSNTRWKALAEIYKICIPLHRSDRKISAKNRPTFCEIEYWIFNIFALVQFDFAIFLWNFDEILSEFRDKSQKIMKIIEMLMKNAEKMRKFLENSGIAGKFQSGYWIFQSCP